jgi:hypothetical protein
MEEFEDSTFKKLKGLTPDEAWQIYTTVFNELIFMSDNSIVTLSDIEERMDREFKPYSLTYNQFQRIYSYDGNIS